MPDILCLGEPLIEFNNTRGCEHYLQGFGGDTSNVAVAAARQGTQAGVLTALGADAFGDMLMALWAREGVDARQVKRDPQAATGLYFVTHGPEGHAFSYLRAGSAASRYAAADLAEDAFSAVRVLHASGISQAISDVAADTVFTAMERARTAGVLVSYDTNLRLRLWPLARARAVMHAAMALADIAFPSLDDTRHLTGLEDADAVADFYLAMGPKIVACKLGEEGALVATPERRERVPALRVDAVDATGAGDTFDGAFLAEYTGTGDPFRAARYANAAAALKTRGYGAVAPMPRRAEVLAALGESA